MIWVTLLVCEILLEMFGLYDSLVGIIAIKNKFDVKTITGIVLHYNCIINMVDCGLKVTVAIWLLIGPDEHSCYWWATVFVWTKFCRFFAIHSIAIIRLISILVEKYQIQYSTNLKLVVFASLVSLAATMVAVLPIKPVLHIGFFAQVSLYSVQKYLNKKDASKKLF